MNSYIVSNLLVLISSRTELSEMTFSWYNSIELIYKEHLTIVENGT